MPKPAPKSLCYSPEKVWRCDPGIPPTISARFVLLFQKDMRKVGQFLNHKARQFLSNPEDWALQRDATSAALFPRTVGLSKTLLANSVLLLL